MQSILTDHCPPPPPQTTQLSPKACSSSHSHWLHSYTVNTWQFLIKETCPFLKELRMSGPVHTSVISSGELAAASYLRLGKPKCIDLIHTCLRPRCDDLRSRGHRKSLRLRSGTVSLDVGTQTDANSRTHVNECGTVTCVTAASSTEEMTDV
jgi:hypothetical protein